MADRTESRRSIRWFPVLGTLFLVTWVGALIAGVVAVAGDISEPSGGTRRWGEEILQGSGAHKIALIEIVGEIVPGRSGESLFSEGGLGSDDYVSMMRQALEDDGVRAVIIRLDTPGGAVVASEDIHQMAVELAAKKPVYASMADVAASGGYYVAAAARRIYASESTVTGSIGVIAMFPNLEGTAKKLGVRPIVIKSGKFKDMGSPFRDLTDKERSIFQATVDDAYDGFVRVVSEGRKMSIEEARRLADGRIYSGRQAKAARLVDEIGNLDTVYDALRQENRLGDARLVTYTRSVGFGGLFGLFRPPDIRAALRDAGVDIGAVTRRPGLSYLWLP